MGFVRVLIAVFQAVVQGASVTAQGHSGVPGGFQSHVEEGIVTVTLAVVPPPLAAGVLRAVGMVPVCPLGRGELIQPVVAVAVLDGGVLSFDEHRWGPIVCFAAIDVLLLLSLDRFSLFFELNNSFLIEKRRVFKGSFFFIQYSICPVFE